MIRQRSAWVGVCAGLTLIASACNALLGVEEITADQNTSAAGGSIGQGGSDATTVAGGDGGASPGSAASCDDAVQNGSETDRDCGGLCGPCDDGAACTVASDCQTAVCDDGACQAASCDDDVRNGQEVDVDCGGDCATCANGQQCSESGQCASGLCDPTSAKCVPLSCGDGSLNADESDVDCGGNCQQCENGSTCVEDGDCVSGRCSVGQCASWTASFGGDDETSGYGEQVVAITSDASSNIFILATTQNAAPAEYSVGDETATVGAGMYWLLSKYSPAGDVQWLTVIGDGNDTEVLNAIATDAAGNVWAVGAPAAGHDYGDGVVPTLGGRDFMLVKYSGETGEYVDSKRFGGPNDEGLYDVAFTSDGDLLVAGFCSAESSMGGEALPNAGTTDGCVARLSADTLDEVWSLSLGGSGDDAFGTVDTDAADSVFVALSYNSEDLEIDGDAYATAGSYDLAALKLSGTDRELMWVKRLGTSGVDTGGVRVAPNGDALVYGRSTQASGESLSLGGKSKLCGAFACAWGARLDASNGSGQWLEALVGQAESADGCSDRAGNLVLVGSAVGDVDFGAGNVSAPGAGINTFFTKLGFDSGSTLAGALYGSDGDDRGLAAACQPNGGAVIAGSFHGTVQFPGEPRTSNGGGDAFVSSLGSL